jgi:flagellar biosynthesis GTPase FlhF
MSDHQTQIDQLFNKDKEVNGNLIMNVNKMEADVKTIMEKFKPANQTNLDSKLEKVKESLNTLHHTS